MKKIITGLWLFPIATSLFSQSQATFSNPRLSDLHTRFYEEYDQRKIENPSFAEQEDTEDDGLLAKFERWEWLMHTRLMPDGTLPEPGIAARERESYLFFHPASGARSTSWTQVGTSVLPGNGGGAGRINVIRIDPSNSNTIYIGTAGGGVWKSTNAGTAWTPITDNISDLSIADIAIDPANSNNIYIATGDGYGYCLGQSGDFWGGLYSAGVLHSTDAGATWAITGLSYNQSDKIIIQRLVIDPANSNNLLAATKSGISHSIDGGITWTQTLAGHYYDIEFNTANSSTVYCSGNNNLYKSTDGGATWAIMTTSVGNDRISIEVSAANSQVIYGLAIGGSLFKSTDGGDTWVTKTYPSAASFFGYYDGVLTCSDANSDFLVVGGCAMVKSTDGGTTWTSMSGTHSDHHAFTFLPGSTSTFFDGDDGGIYKTTNSGSTWTNLSTGLCIAQIYRVASSATDPNIVYSGWQDNGSNRWDGNTGTWTKVYGSDGMDCMIDFTNPQNVYVSYQYGVLEKSTNGGSSFSSVAPCSANWLTPVEMDPVTPSTIYQGCSSIYKSTNSGTSWTNIGDALFSTVSNNACEDIEIAPSDVNTIYACSFSKIVKTSNGGAAWTTITGTLPVTNTGINQIAISNTDPNKVWICLGGYTSANKVFKSTDGGTTWVNISGTLPNIPVNTIVFQNNSPDRLYAGTDIGVYYIDNNSGDWTYYSDGLPNVMVHELEINYTSNKLIAGTYGRGLWQSDLVGNNSQLAITTVSITQNPVCPNGALNVSYAATGSFNWGNVFTAQLSNANGSFSSPVSIGTFSSTGSGSVACTIPGNASGMSYRIRVVSSDPAVVGTDNASNLTITCPVAANTSSSGVAATSATLSWTGSSCAMSYEVNYKKFGSAGWVTIPNITSPYVTLSGLAPSTKYQWKVKTVCVGSPDNSLSFSSNGNFKTLSGRFENLSEPTVEVYPNPSNGNFVLTISAEANAISVYNLLGQEIWAQNDISANTTLNISLNEPAGVYFVRVQTGNRSITKRMMIE